jgi:hypothetical protein
MRSDDEATGAPDEASTATARCDNCGSKLDLDTWTPVASGTGETGQTVLYRFCDRECRAEGTRDGSG